MATEPGPGVLRYRMAITGERAAAIVRRGIGATEKRSSDKMEFEDLIPTLDVWLEAFGDTLDAFLAKRQGAPRGRRQT